MGGVSWGLYTERFFHLKQVCQRQNGILKVLCLLLKIAAELIWYDFSPVLLHE